MARMNRTEVELSAITGTFKGIRLKDIRPNMIKSSQEMLDFITIVNLHNLEVLDDHDGVFVARKYLREIGIKNFE